MGTGGAVTVPTAPQLCRTPPGQGWHWEVMRLVAGRAASSHISAQPRVTLGTRSPAPSPCTHPRVSLGAGGGHPPSRADGHSQQKCQLGISRQAEDKFLLSQWPFGRQFIYLGCCSLIVHGNVYPKYLIAGLHKLRLPGEEVQAAVRAGINISSPGTTKVKDNFSLLPKNHILSASKSDIF